MAIYAAHRWWLWGGSALVASTVLEFTFPAYLTDRALLSGIVLGLGLFCFSFGGGVAQNVFGGALPGTIATGLLGGWSIANGLLTMGAPGWVTVTNTPEAGVITGFARIAVLLVIVLQLGRNERLNRRWRWTPLWAVCIEAAGWVVTQVVLVNSFGTTGPEILAVTAWAGFINAAVPIFIGVLGILASQVAARNEH
ncbi:hypothetical protein ACL9RL_11315 [Plantibacter sp. Mn2098]|uniref:hypothetical protein n=1 Tax=Plantibacter sp. Mn2098 TaxID=3395266 RepID=UPI003BC0F66D